MGAAAAVVPPPPPSPSPRNWGALRRHGDEREPIGRERETTSDTCIWTQMSEKWAATMRIGCRQGDREIHGHQPSIWRIISPLLFSNAQTMNGGGGRKGSRCHHKAIQEGLFRQKQR